MNSARRVVSFSLFLLAAGFAFSELFAVFTLGPIPHGRSIALTVLLLSALVPDFAIGILLLFLPLFGNKPATSQFAYFLLVQSAVYLGLLFRTIVDERRRGMTDAESAENSALWTAVLAYTAASVLGLIALPLGASLREIQTRFSGFDVKVAAANILSFTALAEDKQSYAFFSCLLTVLAVAIGGLILKRARFRSPARFGAAILLGLIAALIFGLSDYYRLIDLRALRGLDPVINPGNAQFRLQSFFGHSGWFAEYVTLTVPFTLLILLQPLPFRLRVLECLIVLMLGEYVLILTYQRGGWVSYPLTLFAIWAAIYVVRRLEQGEREVLTAFRKSLLKVCLSLPITVLLSLAVITAGVKSGVFSGEVQTSVGNYLNRFADIQKTSDRTDFMLAGYRIGALHPFLGAGSESFGYQFHKEFEQETGHYPGELVLPLHGTAHTLYFQIFSGKGIGGLFLLLIAVVYLLVPALRIVVKDTESSMERKVFLLAASCFACSFLVYGVVQEIFYIQCLQVLFFAVMGLAAAAMPEVRFSRREERLLWSFLLLMFCSHLIWEKRVFAAMNSDPGEKAGAYGCFDPERDGAGRTFRWCAPRAKVLLPLETDSEGNHVKLKIGIDFLLPGLSSAAMSASIAGGSAVRAEIPALNEGILRISVPAGIETHKTAEGARVAVDIRANSFFIPRFVFRSGSDYRMLSFRLYDER